MSDVFDGGCFCGAVRYRATAPPSNLTHCHCTICRRLSAAPFVTWATFPSDGFRFTAGAPARIASSTRAGRTFCGRCGTPLTFQLNAEAGWLDVTVCSLDRPEAIAPEDHTQTRTALPWVKLADGLPRHEADRPPARA